MAEAAKSSVDGVSQMSSQKTSNGDKSVADVTSVRQSTTGDGSANKPTRSRPSKLKTPLDLVISTDVSAVCSSHHRPIGTPPPTSLRKPRLSELHAAFPADQFDSFPKINVESLEGPEEDDEVQGDDRMDVGNPTAGMTEESRPEHHHKSMDRDDLDAAIAIVPLSPSGLIPPQRIMTRDQDGVVFELTSHEIQKCPVSPTKKPTRPDPVSK